MAAPIRTDIATASDATAIEALILDFEQSAEARKLRAPARTEPTLDQIQAEYDRAVRAAATAFHRGFGPAVYRSLLADLASWPAAFQRRIGEPLRDARDGRGGKGWQSPQWRFRPDWIWERFKEGRLLRADEEAVDPNGCRCGCRGFNGDFVRHLRMIRMESAEAREARAKAVHAPRAKAVLRRRRERIEHHKRELLALLWLHGQRKIDRARLREHAAEHMRAELAETRRRIAKAPAEIREARARLRENRTHNRQGPTDRPMSPGLRLETERFIQERKRRLPEWRARAAESSASTR
jgi:hypothetical protein